LQPLPDEEIFAAEAVRTADFRNDERQRKTLVAEALPEPSGEERPGAGGKMESLLDSFLDVPYVRTLKKESLFNQFYSDLATELPARIEVPGTQFHVFYALGMGAKYEKHYLHYFAHPDIRRRNMNHETFFFFCPEEWTAEVLSCCGMRPQEQSAETE
jgi:hypothetical protein